MARLCRGFDPFGDKKKLNAFAICAGEVNVFSFKVMVLFLGVLWLIRALSSKEYVRCVCDPIVCLGIPFICQFVCLYEGCDFIV